MKKLFKSLSLTAFLMFCAGESYAAAANAAAAPAHISPIPKFLTAMLGVLLSSLVIFIVLKLYKKFMLKSGARNYGNQEDTLESPKDFKEAINSFLDKTDK